MHARTVSTTAGQVRELALWTGRGAPDPTQGVLVQVRADAGGAGSATFASATSASAAGVVVDLSAGSTSATVVLRPDAAGRVPVTTTVATRLTVTVVGRVTSVPDAGPGAGGTQLVDPVTVVDASAGVGGVVPGPGGALTVPLAGAAVPVEGARAVWLSVRSTASASGALDFRTADGAGTTVIATGPRARTDLVLAELDDRGDLTVAVRGSTPTALGVSVVGWVADGSAVGGLVPITPAEVRWSPSVGPFGQLTLAGGEVPASASAVVVRAAVTTGFLPGRLQVGASVLGSLLLPDVGVPLAAGTTTDVTLVAPVGAAGRATVLLPVGARLVSAVALGYVGAPASAGADRTAPDLQVLSPLAGATLDQGESPEVEIAGTARDTGSGVRSVSVAAGPVALGGAALRAVGDGSVTWSLTAPVPEGRHVLTVTATDWAGRERVVRQDLTVDAAAADAVVVAPDTRVLDGDAADAVLVVEPDRVVLAGASPLRAGDVVVSGVSDAAPEGFLRRVDAVTVSGGTTVLHTSQAVLTDVVLQADVVVSDIPLDGDDVVIGPDGTPVDEKARLAPSGAQSGMSARAAELTYAISRDVAKRDFLDGLASASAKVDFSLTLAFELKIDMDVSWTSISAEIETFSVQQTAKTAVSGTIESKQEVSLEDDVDLSRIRLGAVTIPVGPVPVVLTSQLAPTVYYELEASASLGVTVKASGSATTGFAYRDGSWEPIENHDWSVDVEPSSTLEFTAGAGVRFGLDVKLWDVAGPELRLSVGPQLKAEIDLLKRVVTTKASVIVHVELAVKAEVLGHELAETSMDLGKITIPLGEWVLDLSGDGGETPEDPDDPGEGPGDPGENPGDPGENPGDPGEETGLPDIGELYPATGTPEGTTRVEITGDNLTDVVAVTFGGVPARSFDAYNGMISAVSPEHAPGPVDVVVTTAAGASTVTPVSTFLYQDPPVNARYRDLDISPNHVIAVLEDGTVHGSGSNYQGQLGVPGQEYGEQLVVPGLTDVVQAAAGHQHSLAVTRTGEVYAWGEGGAGQLGLGTTDSATTPQRVLGLPRVIDVAASGNTSVALGVDGSVWTWGVLGESTPALLVPTRAEGPPAAVSVAVGGWFSDGSHVLALTADGVVWAWGDGGWGQLGDGTSTDRTTPGLVPGLTGVVAVAAGEDFSVALTADGRVHTWGRNDDGQLGHGDTQMRTVPEVIASFADVQQVSAGRDHVLAVDTDGSVWAWGSGYHYQVRTRDGFGSSLPVLDPYAPRAGTAVAGSGYVSVVVSTRGGVWAWGEQYHSGSDAIQAGGRVPGWWVDPS